MNTEQTIKRGRGRPKKIEQVRGRGRPKKIVAQAPQQLDIFSALNLVASWSKRDRKVVSGAFLVLDELEKLGWKYAKQTSN